jgi:diguanylate cyclase (GGDEF)-like protein
VNYQTLKDNNLIDLSTGLYNQKYLERRLEEEISRARRNRHFLSFMIFDFDIIGVSDEEKALIESKVKDLVDKIKLMVRDIDILTKYRNSEFAIILPETPKEGAACVSSRIKNTITNFVTSETSEGIRKINLGYSTFPIDASNKENLIGYAKADLWDQSDYGGEA